jgi:hypothetical protein
VHNAREHQWGFDNDAPGCGGRRGRDLGMNGL